MNKEIQDGLKSTFDEKVENLKALQAEGVEVITEVNQAKEANDAGKLSEASEKFEKVGEAIKAAQAEVEAVQEQMGWFKEYQYQDETEVKEQRKEELREMFEALKSNGTLGEKAPQKTVGETFADVLTYRGIKSGMDIADLNADTRVVFHFGDYEPSTPGSYKNVKSLYSNQGTALLDGSDPVPGFMGVQCGLVEDRNIYCLLDPPADDFEACVSRATLNGNRIRFNYEAARDSAAASVYETVYNPYPTFERDGTKPEGSFTIGTAEVGLVKIAEFIVASDEVLEDCGFVANMIDHVLTSNINAEKRRQMIAGLGVASNELLGILNQPNLLTRTHGDAADGGSADDNIYDTLRRSLTDIWLQNGSTDNVCAIVHPRELESVDLLKDEFGRYLFNDSECFSRMLRCITLRTSVDMPQGTAVLGNFANNWVFYLRRQLEIRMGYTGDQFITNTNTILGEMRALQLVRCPRKIIKIDGLPATEVSPS